MRTVLSAVTFDPAGVVILDVNEQSNFGELRRRMNRVATLDGGAVFNDFGYSEADRSINLVWDVTNPADEAIVAHLISTYATLHVVTPSGLFLCAPERYVPGAAESTLSLLVVSKLA